MTREEAGSGGASRSATAQAIRAADFRAAAQASHKDQSQIYAAQRPSVWNRLGRAEAGTNSQWSKTDLSRLGRAEAGGGGASMPAGAQSFPYGLPCYFAAIYHCLGVTLVDKDGRSVTKCPMWAHDKCP